MKRLAPICKGKREIIIIIKIIHIVCNCQQNDWTNQIMNNRSSTPPDFFVVKSPIIKACKILLQSHIGRIFEAAY